MRLCDNRVKRVSYPDDMLEMQDHPHFRAQLTPTALNITSYLSAARSSSLLSHDCLYLPIEKALENVQIYLSRLHLVTPL